MVCIKLCRIIDIIMSMNSGQSKETNMQRMSASDVKNHWGDLVRAIADGERVVVESRREPILVAISPADYEEFQALQKAKRLQEAREALQRIQERQWELTKHLSDAEADAIIERVMEEDRIERAEKLLAPKR
jgi:prevent-host-death family protein